jgi:hypothetical protein
MPKKNSRKSLEQKSPKKVAKEEKEEESEEETGPSFEVDKILDHKYDSRKKKLFLLIKWKGYSEEDNTWEPLSNMLSCDERLNNYFNAIAK